MNNTIYWITTGGVSPQLIESATLHCSNYPGTIVASLLSQQRVNIVNISIKKVYGVRREVNGEVRAVDPREKCLTTTKKNQEWT